MSVATLIMILYYTGVACVELMYHVFKVAVISARP